MSHILQDSNQNHILDYCSPPITDQTGWSDITLKLSTSEVNKIHHHIKLECAAGNTDVNCLLIPWWLQQPPIADTCRYITKLQNNYLKTGNIPRFEPSTHRGPTLQFTGCKGPTVKHLNGSHFQASVGQSCLSSVKATYTILCRWFSCCGWWVLGLVFHLMSLCLCSAFHTLHFISFTTCQAFFFCLKFIPHLLIQLHYKKKAPWNVIHTVLGVKSQAILGRPLIFLAWRKPQTLIKVQYGILKELL